MAPGRAHVVPVSGEGAEGLAAAVFEFMEGIRPKGGVIGPPYVHRLGPTHGPDFIIREMLPPWWAVHPPAWPFRDCPSCDAGG
jgi:hypothetical protein